ncbi:hypothetical protein C8546_23120, partial [Salmonella enterica subsp. enterica serovar Muenchen]|nr:hypothetical protein [Salmonella enterica subsp. enterica serovar Muenchen]
MKLTLFKLHSNSKDYSSFIKTNWNRFYETIQYKAMHEQKWKPFNIDDFVIPEFELDSSDTGKKNFQHDISATSKPFIVLSEHAVEALKDILEPRGQFLPINTPSKRKKFI